MPRARLLAAALVLFPSVLLAQGTEQRIDQRLPAAPDVSLRIHNMEGSVRIEGWDRDTIAVSGTLDRETQRFFMGGNRQAAKLGVEGPLSLEQSPAHLYIRVPAGARVWVKTAGASIVLTGLTGGVDAFSTSGAIRFEGEPAQLNAETMDGSIEINAGGTWVRAKTASGPITIRGPAEDVAATTVSGSVTMLSSGMRRARLESVTGDLGFSGWLTRDGVLAIENHGGTIDVLLPGSIVAEFDLSSYHGRIQNEFQRFDPSPGRSGGEQSFSVGEGGGARVSIRTFKGNIQLRRK